MILINRLKLLRNITKFMDLTRVKNKRNGTVLKDMNDAKRAKV